MLSHTCTFIDSDPKFIPVSRTLFGVATLAVSLHCTTVRTQYKNISGLMSYLNVLGTRILVLQAPHQWVWEAANRPGLAGGLGSGSPPSKNNLMDLFVLV